MSSPEIRFGKHVCRLDEGETLLDGLLRSGVNVAHACKAGACGSCLMRAVKGEVPGPAQRGLKEAWKVKGYLLACQCRPENDIEVDLPGEDACVDARILSLEWLSGDVLRVRLACAGGLDYRPGQYVTLRRGDGLARSYSIANLPVDGDWIEHHVRVLAGGRMSTWLADGGVVGERLAVIGPSGDCFYVAGKPEQNLLLVGTGTGLAPLYGIVRDALAQGHRGQIHLFHGAVRPEGLYLVEELERMAREHGNLLYTATVLEGSRLGVVEGAVDSVVLAQYANLKNWRGFLCGDPQLVNKLKKRFFLAGMNLSEIHADAFLPAAAS